MNPVCLKITTGQPETVIRKKTDSTMVKRNRTKQQAMVDSKPHRKPKMEKYALHQTPRVKSSAVEGQAVTTVSLLPPAT